jgi:DNA-binding MarR family transcriptional regulator
MTRTHDTGTDNTGDSLKDPLEDLLSYQLRRAAFVTLSSLSEAFGRLELTPTEAIVIRFVHANPGCTQAEIGRALGVKRTNMVPIANGLMTRGLIERTAADGRSHSLYLTKTGNELHRKIAKASLDHEQRFFGDTPAATRQILMQTFRSLRAKAEEP